MDLFALKLGSLRLLNTYTIADRKVDFAFCYRSIKWIIIFGNEINNKLSDIFWNDFYRERGTKKNCKIEIACTQRKSLHLICVDVTLCAVCI